MVKFLKTRPYPMIIAMCMSAFGAYMAAAQTPPPVNTTPTPTQISTPVALASFSAPVAVTGIDAGAVVVVGTLTSPTFSVEQLEFVCCGTTATAFPTALANRIGLFVQNFGPNTACEAGSGLVTMNLCGTGLGGATATGPGDAVFVSAVAADSQFCVSSVAQTDGGCLQVREVR